MAGLVRGLGLLEATALNMSNMIGVGPFITIPLVLAAMGGPQAMLGWALGLVIALCDGLIWSELGAAMPGTGGTYRYLREAFGPASWGRLLGFLFIWQFVLSGPLEIASGYAGLAQYTTYLWHATPLRTRSIAAAAGAANLLLLYRGIRSVGRLTVVLWLGTLVTSLAVIASGLPRFDPRLAFDFPPGAFHLTRGFWLGLGASSLIAIYDYLGYYDICYLGQEVREPARVIPRSILVSLLCVALLYFCIYLSIIGVVPWREAAKSSFVVSDFMQRLYGPRVAAVFTVLILWTAFGSTFALLLGYSRIPYAAALDGCFFRPFARLHEKGFPHVALLVVGLLSIAASFLDVDTLVSALMTTRILVQFLAQIAAVVLLRRSRPAESLPFKMWLYPLPCVVAGLGWCFVFATSGTRFIAVGVATLVVGVAAYLLWSRATGSWPFARAALSRRGEGRIGPMVPGK